MTRREQLYPEIRRLREDEGLVWREIGERLGIALQTAQSYYADPTGEEDRARKAKFDRPCGACGKMLRLNGNEPDRTGLCRTCIGANKRADSRRWILDSFAEWNERFGAPPSPLDWSPTQARSGYCGWKAERYEATGRPWPSPTLVMNHFGSWNAGLAAAGFDVLPKSEHWLGHAGRALRTADAEGIE